MDKAKTAAFLKEALPVVAALGGVNPTSLLRLRGIAHKYGLDATQMADILRKSGEVREALATYRENSGNKSSRVRDDSSEGVTRRGPGSRGSSSDSLSREQSREIKTRFARKAAKTMRKTEGLWPPVYKHLLKEARKAGLGNLKAMRLIEWVASKLKLPFIPASEAESYLAANIRAAMVHQELSVAEYARLKSLGAKLGISSPKFRQMVRGQVVDKKPARTQTPPPVSPSPTVAPTPRRRSRDFPWVEVLAIGLCVLLVIAAWYWLLMRPAPKTNPEGPPEQAEATGKNNPPAPQAEAPAPALRAPGPIAWGSPELATLYQKAEQGLPEADKQLLWQIGLADPAPRKAAYPKLIGRPGAALTAFLAACFREEPADANAEAILAASPPIPSHAAFLDAKQPVSPQMVDDWLLASDRLASICLDSPSNPDRADLAANYLKKRLGNEVDPQADPDQLFSDFHQNALRKIYNILAAHAKVSPAKALALCEQVRARANDVLGAPGRLASETAVIEGIFSSSDMAVAPEFLAKVKQFIYELTARDNPERDRLVALLDKGDASPFFGPLEEALVAASGLPKDPDPKAMAAALKDHFRGKTNPEKTNDQAPRLIEASKLAFAAPVPSSENLRGQLTDILRFSHLTNLACALAAQDKPQIDRFEELASQAPYADFANPAGIQGQPNTAPNAWTNPFAGNQGLPFANIARPIPAGDASKMTRFLFTSSVNDRAVAFASLCQHVDPAQMPYDIADSLARYLFRSSMHNDELLMIQYHLPKVANAPMLKLAMSERILSAPKSCPGAFLAIGEIVGAVPDQGPRWRQSARRALLESIAYGGSQKNSVVLGTAGDLYMNSLREQGRLIGVPDPEYLFRTTPSSMIEANTRYLAAGIPRDKLAPEDQRFLDNLPNLAVIYSFLKLNDLQVAALQQRSYLKTLQLHISRVRPDLDARTKAVVSDLANGDKASDQVLVRLRAGEAAILRAWLLLLEKKP